MAFSYGRQFRRIAAQALTADPDEMRAAMRRMLPPRENGAPALRLATEADCKEAPAVIVFAFFADALTGDEAADLLRQALSPAFRKEVPQRLREDPLARSIRAWGAGLPEPPGSNPAPLPPVYLRPASGEAGGLVKNNENTSAQPHPTAAGETDQAPQPARIVEENARPAAGAMQNEEPADRAEATGEQANNKQEQEHDPEKWVPVFGKDHAPVETASSGRWLSVLGLGVATGHTGGSGP